MDYYGTGAARTAGAEHQHTRDATPHGNTAASLSAYLEYSKDKPWFKSDPNHGASLLSWLLSQEGAASNLAAAGGTRQLEAAHRRLAHRCQVIRHPARPSRKRGRVRHSPFSFPVHIAPVMPSVHVFVLRFATEASLFSSQNPSLGINIKENRENPKYLADLKKGLRNLAHQDAAGVLSSGKANTGIRHAARQCSSAGENMYSTLRRYWNGIENTASKEVTRIGIKHVGLNSLGWVGSDTLKARLQAIDDLELVSLGSPDFLDQQFFSKTEFDAVAEAVDIFGKFGFPMDQGSWRATLHRIAVAKLEEQVKKGTRTWYNPKLQDDGGDVPVCGQARQRARRRRDRSGSGRRCP